MITLDELNGCAAHEFVAALAAIVEHSPWVPERVASLRPFKCIAALHRAMSDAVLTSGVERQLALIRAHPELAGRAALGGALTAASTGEQRGAGLSACTPEQLRRLRDLNGEYRERFGFPFILAVKGHTPDSVIAAMAERVTHDAAAEHAVAVAEICRIAGFRLAELVSEPWGTAIVGMADELAQLSESVSGLTCSYLTPTHRATAACIRDWMLAAGLEVHIDAVGNVVGVLTGDASGSREAPGSHDAPRLLTGSHYDTVVNAGKYDGRLGILLPIVVAGAQRRAGRKMPFTLEIIAFAEEEGVRFKSTFLGSRAVAGLFTPELLDSVDGDGITLRDAIRLAGHDPAAIAAIARDANRVACFVEVHIEQGPVLLTAASALGVVTEIAGSSRRMVTVSGISGHAGTVPMALRRDAAAAAAEMVLAVERCCAASVEVVGTVGKLGVPGGAINVIPGQCEFSIDIRAGNDAARTAAFDAIIAEFARIAERRGVEVRQTLVLETGSVPCSTVLQDGWAASIERVTGKPALRLASGAGHDAMMMANVAPMGMLFVRCGNGGISHHPSETLSADDADIAARAFEDFLWHIDITNFARRSGS